ncbi:MAG: class I SAM-dependent methyltransferase [Arthrospira platensis PCC 7345]|uniref:class I SAM-dependent methyltransferase n=1 Tax=Limnospira platensis TaxID=118562 RepID=UPI0028E1402E|nr:class I SAM-dependent methyltransferase [Arthrospira platensis PCC 7345]
MSLVPPNNLRQKIIEMVENSQSHPTAWFESLYAESQGDPSLIPWATLVAHPQLQQWLKNHAIEDDNKTAVVLGCGLGDDAEALADFGFQVTAFDISPTAIAWCRERFPNSQVNYTVADLLDPDPNWREKFDFVLESRITQSMPLQVRSQAIKAIANLVAPDGILLLITRFRDTEAAPDGPPWPLSEAELSAFKTCGLTEINRHEFVAENRPDARQLCIEYKSINEPFS